MAKIVVNDKPLKLAVSACLLGELVRYDGGHRRHPFVAEVLADLFDLVAVCPEVGVGMGVPRPMIQLVDQGGGLRVLRVGDPQCDETERLRRYSAQMAVELGQVSGYVLKSRSPSCGLRVPVVPQGVSPGLFAGEIARAWPQLPMVEDDALADEVAQQRFIDQVVAYGQR